MITIEIAPGIVCWIVGAVFFIIGWNRLRFDHPWFFVTGLFSFGFFGTLMLVPMEPIIGEGPKWGLLVLMAALLVLSPFLRNLYLHWTNWAEIEAQELASNGRYHAAIKLLQSVRTGREPSLLLLNLLAFSLHAIGRYEEALEVVEEAELRFGLSHELSTKKAFCLARLGETEAALSLFAPMLDLLPNDFDLIFQYASLLLQMGMHEDAERQYDRAEVMFLREASDERKQEWRPKLDKMRSVLRGGISR